MHWNFLLESYLVTLFVPELQKIMLRKWARLNGNCAKQNVFISEPLLEIVKPSVVTVLKHRFLFIYRIWTCSSYLWVLFDLGCQLSDSSELPVKLQGVIPCRALPGRAEHGWVWVSAELWLPSAMGSRIGPGGEAALPAHLIYFWFVGISKTQTKSTLSWPGRKADTWMALCIVYSVVLEHCSAVSTLLCDTHSSGQLPAFLSISEQQLHTSHLFKQLQGQPGSGTRRGFYGNWWPFSTSVCARADSAAFITPWLWSSCPSVIESTVPLQVLFHSDQEAL